MWTATMIRTMMRMDVIIIDAEREYGPLAKALGGEIIEDAGDLGHPDRVFGAAGDLAGV